MATITLTLTDESATKLLALAGAANAAPEDLARDAIEEWLRRQHADYVRAAEHVLKKNAELYRRLA